MLLILVFLIQKRPPSRPSPIIILAGLLFAGDIALWHWALSITTVANSTFIVNLGNIGVGFLAWIVMKERPAPAWFFAIFLAVSGAAALSLAGGEGSKESFMPPSLKGFAAPLFLAIIVQVLGQGLIITGLGNTPASIAGVLIVVQPVVAAAIAWSLFDEPLTGLQMGGCAKTSIYGAG